MRSKQLQRRATWRGGQDGHSEDVFSLDPMIHRVNKKKRRGKEAVTSLVLLVIRLQSPDRANRLVGGGFQINGLLGGLSEFSSQPRREQCDSLKGVCQLVDRDFDVVVHAPTHRRT
jgi:hypothetical protein